ncbi:MAG: bacteriohemerythrin [Bryobacteraceae bacterium]|jgi:hemerythrin-like metal-binding protein
MATATVLFPWKDTYNVGIAQIDSQHRALVKLINDLHSAMQAGKAREVLGSIIDELISYTGRHFNDEEAMLRMRGYSKLAAHHAIHQDLTRQVVELRDKFRASKLALSVEVMQFLKNWLASHILTHDQAYAKELSARN